MVVGGRNAAQFEDLLQAPTLTLDAAQLQRLDDVSRLPLVYPYWHQRNFARERFRAADRALHGSYPDRHYGGEDLLV